MHQGGAAYGRGYRIVSAVALLLSLSAAAPVDLPAEGADAPEAEEFSFSKAIFDEITDNAEHPYLDLGSISVAGKRLELKVTKHLILLAIVTALVLASMLYLAAKLKHPYDKPTRLQGLFEVLLEYMEREVYAPNLGEKGKRYYPLCFALFLFVLYSNLVGLIPPFVPIRVAGAGGAGEATRVWLGGAITGNLAVTAGLGLVTFLVLNVAGMRAKGVVGYWKGLVPHGTPGWLAPFTWLIEVVGLLSKTISLIMRLFANMIGGHIAMLVILLLVIKLHSLSVAPIALLVDVAIFALEMFVAVLQAYIFSFLSALFIGLAVRSH